jgi:hypothetical protein
VEKRNPALSVFTIVLGLLYGVIASGQILGFCKLESTAKTHHGAHRVDRACKVYE